MKKRLPTILFTVCSLCAPLQAAESSWVDVAPGAQMRVITSDKLSSQDTTLVGLEFQLRDGMKTYWRIPGESGIPLTANWDASQNIENIDILWPMPKRSVVDGYFDYVYDHDFVLPIRVQLKDQTQPTKLIGDLILGICGEICVPVTFDVNQQLNFDKTDAATNFRLNAALADVPIEDTRKQSPFAAAYIDVEKNNIAIPLSTDQSENHTLIVDLPNSSVLFDLPQNSPGSSVLTVAPLENIELKDLIGSSIYLTYTGREGAFEKKVPVLSFNAHQD